MFVRASSGEAYPARRVERIWREYGPSNKVDGFADIEGIGKIRLCSGEYERIFAGSVTFVSAISGWKTLERFEDEEGYELLENDVLGWGIYEDGHVVPVTLEGVDCGDAQFEAFLKPDGKVLDKSGLNELAREDFYKGGE
jgi:hypothetical protein